MLQFSNGKSNLTHPNGAHRSVRNFGNLSRNIRKSLSKRLKQYSGGSRNRLEISGRSSIVMTRHYLNVQHLRPIDRSLVVIAK